MFCFQCEQTLACKGCMGKAGVCGKSAQVAQDQDELVGALVAFAQMVPQDAQLKPAAWNSLIDSLFMTLTNVNFDDESIKNELNAIHALKDCLIKERITDKLLDDFDMNTVWNADEDTRSLKSLILFGMKGIAAYAHHAALLGYRDREVDNFFLEGLRALASDMSTDELLQTALNAGKANLACMELLDQANTETYGDPEPTQVPLDIEPGPFIVVSGHDLSDLKLLLEQTKGTGVNVYTHGEMLPAHAYPELKKYPQLKGNFGTAWQNQQKEFADIPAPVLFTTNCLMPPRPSYADRVYTTDVVSFPGLVHIGKDKDFTPIIEKAKVLGGYPKKHEMTGINGGHQVTTGFGRAAVLSHAGDIVQAVKDGKISHFFLVGGCDGARPGRNYYTEFVKQTPKDSIVLTLACGKYRFNDLDLGTVAGFPRILDVGQCNDAYGAVQIALALAQAFNCSVNELPLSFNISWYEQKAVAILLTLLYLGIENIHLGPTLPAFISPNVLKILVDKYHIAPISTPEKDLQEMRA